MIVTQQIKSIAAEPIPYLDYTPINVLRWHSSAWKTLCPYFMRTDGNESNANSGNILFENFYQGSKVYDVVYSNKVYPHKKFEGRPAYLWWEFTPVDPAGDKLIENNNINYELYYRWRNSLWNANHPVRYPNKMHNRSRVKFGLVVDKNGTETRMDYLTMRREIYMKEYIRLAKKTDEYQSLLDKLRQGEKLMICEIDVPAINKKGNFNRCNEHNISHITLPYLETLLNDPNEAFGHGLCLAYALLKDLD